MFNGPGISGNQFSPGQSGAGTFPLICTHRIHSQRRWGERHLGVPNITVTVFNRWGNVVFYSPGYSTPFTGTGLDNGVYSYLIQYGMPLVRLAGSLTLIR